MGRALQTVALLGAVLGLAVAVLGRNQARELSANNSDNAIALSGPRALSIAPPLLAHFSPHTARKMSLGFWRPASYWLNFRMIDFLTFEGQDDVATEGPEVAAGKDSRRRALQAIAAVQPSNESIYLLACYQLALTDEDPAACLPVSESGIAAFPQSFRIAMMQGYVSGVLLDNESEAAHWFKVAQSMTGSPPLAGKMAELYGAQKEWDATTFSESIAFFDDIPGGNGFKEMLQEEASEATPRNEGTARESSDSSDAAADDETVPTEEPTDGEQ